MVERQRGERGGEVGVFKLKRRRVGAREGCWGKERADMKIKAGMKREVCVPRIKFKW